MDKTSIKLIQEAKELLESIELAQGDIKLANDLMRDNKDSHTAKHINNVMENYLNDLFCNYCDIKLAIDIIATLN